MQRNRYIKRAAVAICCICSIFISSFQSRACTSAIISAEASASGRPLLWKHRDTSTTDNKVEFVPSEDGSFSYVALFNAVDRNLEEAWMGMNEAGFAVMNTASYNIKNDKVPEKQMDREGFVMTIALRSCRTLADFEELLRTLPRPMGVEANFGAIDAEGNGAYYETNNTDFVKFDLKDAPDGVLIRTNYSHSGRPNEGYGFIREDNAAHLILPEIKNGITPEFLTETVSRSFYHDLRKADALESGERWAIDEDFIPRYKSTATIVIEGCRPSADASKLSRKDIVNEYVMWTGIGYPPCSEIVPVWCDESGVNSDLRGIQPGGTCRLGNLARQRRDQVFPAQRGGNSKYIDLQTLKNDEGSGFLQVLVPQNLKTYELFRRKRDNGEIHIAD